MSNLEITYRSLLARQDPAQRPLFAQSVVNQAFTQTMGSHILAMPQDNLHLGGGETAQTDVLLGPGHIRRVSIRDAAGALTEVSTRKAEGLALERYCVRSGAEQLAGEVPTPIPIFDVILRRLGHPESEPAGGREYVEYEVGQGTLDLSAGHQETWNVATVRVYADGETTLRDFDGMLHLVKTPQSPGLSLQIHEEDRMHTTGELRNPFWR